MDSEQTQFHIPVNYKSPGYWFNGMLESRKCIEAVICAGIGCFICSFLPLPSSADAVPFYILIGGLSGIGGLMGVHGEPLSTFLVNYFKWRMRRNKPYLYNYDGKAYHANAAGVVLGLASRDSSEQQEKAPKDAEAEKYVLGENFRFAGDPLEASLRTADETLLAKLEQEKAVAEKDTAAEQPPEQAEQTVQGGQTAGGIDVQSIFSSLHGKEGKQ